MSKAGHVCSMASCVSGVWSNPICVPSSDPPCVLNDLAVPDGARVSSDVCLSGWDVPSGTVCGFSKAGHTCDGASCVAGTWSSASCVEAPEDECRFGELQLPSDTFAYGNANCRVDADGGVPAGFSCVLSKPGHTCNAATCLGGGVWSAPLCIPSSNPGCDLSELATPVGSEISVARCLEGGSVATGTVCGFKKVAHTCSGSVCTSGSWSQPSCALSEAGCWFRDLQVPEGADVYGHANCDITAVAPVPSGN